MANNFVNAPKLMQGLTYEEMSKGVQQMNQVHQALSDKQGQLSGMAGAVGANLDPNLDAKTYGIYKAYNDNLMGIASDLAKHGVTKSSLNALKNAQAAYAGTIGKVETAYKTKLQRAEELRQIKMKDPTYMAGWDPATMSTDEFYDNPMISGNGISGEQIRKTVAENAAAVAKETNFSKFATILGGQAFERAKQAGMHSAADVQAALRNPNSHWGQIIYGAILAPVRRSLGYGNWMNADQLNKAMGFEKQGLNYLVGGQERQLHANADYMDALKKAQLAQLTQPQVGPALVNEEDVVIVGNSSDLETKKKTDLARAKDRHNHFTNFYNNGLIDKRGDLTAKGLKELEKPDYYTEAGNVYTNQNAILLRKMGYTKQNHKSNGLTLAKEYANYGKTVAGIKNGDAYKQASFVIPYKDKDAAYNAIARHVGEAGLYGSTADWDKKSFKSSHKKIDLPEKEDVSGIAMQMMNGSARLAFTLKDGSTVYADAPVASRNMQKAIAASKDAQGAANAIAKGVDPKTGRKLSEQEKAHYQALLNEDYQIMQVGALYDNQTEFGVKSDSTNWDYFSYGK